LEPFKVEIVLISRIFMDSAMRREIGFVCVVC